MNDNHEHFEAEIAALKDDIAKAVKNERRERRHLQVAFALIVTLIAAVVVVVATAPSEAQARYLDLADDRYGMSQDTAEQVADMWCDSDGNPDPDQLAALIHQGTDKAGFDRLASTETELVLLTLAAEQAYCPKAK